MLSAELLLVLEYLYIVILLLLHKVSEHYRQRAMKETSDRWTNGTLSLKTSPKTVFPSTNLLLKCQIADI